MLVVEESADSGSGSFIAPEASGEVLRLEGMLVGADMIEAEQRKGWCDDSYTANT